MRWDVPDTPPPKRPFRDSLIMYAVFAAIIVGVAWLTGGDVGKATGVAVFFFVVATGWSWLKWKQRLDAERRRREAAAEAAGGEPGTTPPPPGS
jgi:hypothetical protein